VPTLYQLQSFLDIYYAGDGVLLTEQDFTLTWHGRISSKP
jgi:hypothetical protein